MRTKKRIGRPPEGQADYSLVIRMSGERMSKLIAISKYMAVGRTEVLRLLVDRAYEQIQRPLEEQDWGNLVAPTK